MKIVKMLFIIFILINLSACWNYRELDQVSTAAGVIFDYDEANDKYIVNFEIVTITSNGFAQSQIIPEYFTSEGETIFDAVRNLVSKIGKKMLVSHAKVVFISEKIAKRGILPILDVVERNAEARPDMKLVLVKGFKPNNIYHTTNNLQKIVSFHVYDILQTSKRVSKYPDIAIWQAINELQSDSASSIIPVAYVVKDNGRNIIKISGSAILKGGKLIGFLNEEETKNILFVRNEVRGGIIPIKNVASTNTDVSLEIYNSKSKIIPIIDDNLKFQIDLEIDVYLAEILGDVDFIEEENLNKLKDFAEEKIKQDILETIYKIQSFYGVDIMNLGKTLKIKYPKYWKKNKENWESLLKSSSFSVNVKLNILGSSTTSKIIKVGR